ncbi:heterokaryon incompatibility protein (HET) domain-containing protein [Trichoderma breve]|uniref:Heterokaryon incompatibility protein (HET) domain-containing protein n=1 Tax=Trichoderma breve TaxID=2034170 RepID=A0A9W9JSP7_9HYPO|nr:heterokaryon incompatibility protein (HET) domain-containing protein [Trichoderma breve]KAJ4865530.1 heterokaryon incompatibility protein (HET) domain-containing protein [Trichoderma breve]
MKKNIPYRALPKTFQDAVTVTRALGVPYLWIDSLCIIQEDEKDWETEAIRMEEVFSFAYCTIAASRGTSSLSGFLGKRKPRAYAKIQTSGGPLYLAEAIDDFHADVEQSELSKRGWVLQERALSCRTIYFTATQIYWECGQGICCETLVALRNPQSHVLSDSNFPISSLKYHTNDLIRLVQHINQTYSKLHLTVATDRSKAILGLQSRLARAFESKACYDYSFDQNCWKCIVVGKDKVVNEDGEIVHYVLLVRSVSFAPQTYERVGVGALLEGHISPATESISVI